MHFFLTFVPLVDYHHSQMIFYEQIDSLDTLALLGDKERFSAGVEWVGKNVRFDIVSKHEWHLVNLVSLIKSN
jgi:hypothetical protein